MMLVLLKILLVSSIPMCHATGDVFSSTTNLSALIHTENSVIQALDGAIEDLKVLEETLLSFKDKFIYHENTTEDSVLKYISNPINSFTLIKRLYNDLGELQSFYDKTVENINKEIFNNPKNLYPEKSDFTGIATILRDLQIGYKIDVTNFTNGVIKGVKYGQSLNSDYVYQLGQALCEVAYDDSCKKFLEEALRKWDGTGEISKIEIMQAISDAYYQSQNLTASLEWDNIILEEDFDDVPTLLHKARTLQDLNSGNLPATNTKNISTLYTQEQIDKFNSLCNGESVLPEDVKSMLHCYYKYGKSPFLRIAPLKLEQLYIEPEVVIVRQMISDSEIEEFIELAKGNLKRSHVQHSDGTDDVVDYRISSTAYLPENVTVVERLLRRNADLTDLHFYPKSMDLQVTHYPPGGNYKPHFDMAMSGIEDVIFYNGNRVVTVLHYLSEVVAGGGTAFYDLNIMVEPQKGSAVYWRNLHSSGEGDVRTMHGGCPVLQGIKWVSNMWIHMHNQETATPCGLEYHSHNITETILSRRTNSTKQL